MKLSQLPKIVTKSAKRIGRGIGSGKGGHTSSRGQKGQKSREKIKIFFEGTKMKKSLVKKLPFQRGKGKFKPLTDSPVIVKATDLAKFTGDEVTLVELIKQGLAEKIALKKGVKILGQTPIKKALIVKVPVSQALAKKIVNAGGKIEI